MQVSQLSGYWAREFTRLAAGKPEDILAMQLRLKRDRDEQIQKEEDKKEKRLREEVLMQVIMATTQQIADFEIKLDSYDRATVQALMHNTEALVGVRKEIDEILEQAYVLPDGRRVFRTRDGTQVFDEHGKEVKASEVDPAAIGDKHIDWETYKAKREVEERLLRERQELIDYQEKLDHSRERIRSGESISEDDLKAMDKDLEKSMPEAVKRELPAQPQAAPVASAASTEISMDDMNEMAETRPVQARPSTGMKPAGT